MKMGWAPPVAGWELGTIPLGIPLLLVVTVMLLVPAEVIDGICVAAKE
jgi:hypothetical protein